jgi:hypothetical protein
MYYTSGFENPKLTQFLNDWLPRQESNLDSSDPESDVLPITPQGNITFSIYKNCEREAIGKTVNLGIALGAGLFVLCQLWRSLGDGGTLSTYLYR